MILARSAALAVAVTVGVAVARLSACRGRGGIPQHAITGKRMRLGRSAALAVRVTVGVAVPVGTFGVPGEEHRRQVSYGSPDSRRSRTSVAPIATRRFTAGSATVATVDPPRVEAGSDRRGQAAVDAEVLAGDVARPVGGEERDDLRQLLDAGVPAGGDASPAVFLFGE